MIVCRSSKSAYRSEIRLLLGIGGTLYTYVDPWYPLWDRYIILIIGLLRVGMFISLRFRQRLEPDLKVSKPLKFGVKSGSSDDTAGNRPQFGQSPC